MQGYDTLLWDNDGVLVATEPLYLQASREILASVGVELSEADFARISLQEGQSVFELAAHVDRRQHNALRRQRNRRYSELLAATDTSVPGVRRTLEILANHYRMAIVTTSLGEHFAAAHRVGDLQRFFNFILTRENYRRSKPDPEPYLAALRRFGARAERTLVIEDTPRGLLAARRAGIDCVIIPAPPFTVADYRGARAVLDSIEQLPAFLARPKR